MIEIIIVITGLILLLAIFYFSDKILKAVSDSGSGDLKDKFSETNNTLKSVLESLGGLKESSQQSSLSSDVLSEGSINRAIGNEPIGLFITSPHAPFLSLSNITITVSLNLLSVIFSVAIRK